MEEGWEGTDNLIIVLMYKICSKKKIFTHHVVYPYLTAVRMAAYASSLLLMLMRVLFHC